MLKTPWFQTVNKVLIYNAWPNNRNDFFDNQFANVFEQQKTEENISLNKGDKIIVNCCNEGIGPSDLKEVIETLKNYDVRVLFNSHIHENLPYKYDTYVDYFSAHCGFVNYNQTLDVDWKNLFMMKKFISLNRRASVGRCKLAKKLLDTFKHNTFHLSCGSQPNPYLGIKQNLHDIMHPYTLPVLLDGETGGMKDQHNHSNTDWFACFINLVTETSNQTDPDSWHEVFITEKSLKAFLYRQIPIFWAVPGTVQLLRDIGFDVYDDIIDHSYDNIKDPDLRLNTMISTLKIFLDANSLSTLTNLRSELWLRINKNVELLVKLSEQHPTKFHNKLLELSK
jgi:hypothetical protein